MDSIFKGKKVLITGHTGFKGSWLTLWLKELGAEIIGYSLPPPTEPNLFEACRLEEMIAHYTGDVRDIHHLQQVFNTHNPEIVFHLAAQPLVLEGYRSPKETFDTNIGGTVNVLEVIRNTSSVKAAVIVTTDKVYKNNECPVGYREQDVLGGCDPYSASKAASELVIDSYRRSFFADNSDCGIASARAGNVIGGGDFSAFRILPDCMRSLASGTPIEVRHPKSVRPWLHVLDALSGYLLLAEHLLKRDPQACDAWNFGPLERQGICVEDIVEKAIQVWGQGDWIDKEDPHAKKETNLLQLNWDNALNHLQWKPRWTWEQAVEQTVLWTKAYTAAKDQNHYELTKTHLQQYLGKQLCSLHHSL